MDVKTSRQSDQENLAGTLFAAAGVLALIVAFREVLRGNDLVAAFAGAAIGMGCLGGALAYLGEAPSAPTPRRVYKAVRLLIPVSIVAIAILLLFR